MKPIFQTLANDNDITPVLAAHLMSLSIADEAGWRSDTAAFVLENSAGRLPLPATGAKLDIRLGYEHGGAVVTGQYTVDQIELAGPPDTLTIRSQASAMKGTLKEQHTRAWENITFGNLVAKIAEGHHYKPHVHPALADTVIPFIAQTEESDMHLLTRLAVERDAVFKPADGQLIFAPKDQLTNFAGKPRRVVTVAQGDIIDWRYTSSDRGKYATVKARWRDLGAAATKTVTVGEGRPAYMLKSAYPDAERAEAAARSRLAAFERGSATLELTIGGHPAAKAEAPLDVSGLHPEINKTAWTIQRVRHRLDNQSGFTTWIEATQRKAS